MGDELLERTVERSGAGEGAVDIGVAENGPAACEAEFERCGRHGQEETEERGVEGLGRFKVRQMGGGKAFDLGVRNTAGEGVAVAGPGCGDVMIANDDKGRCCDGGQAGGVIHVADGGGTPSVSGWVCGKKDATGSGDGDRVGGEVCGVEESAEDGIGDGSHALVEDSAAAGFHGRGIGEARGGVGEDEVGKARGFVNGNPLADHAAEGESAEGELGNGERVGEGEEVAGEQFDRIVAGGDIGGAVAASVVAKDTEVRGERVGLRVPLGVVAAERVGEDNRRAIVCTVEAEVLAERAGLEDGHSRS